MNSLRLKTLSFIILLSLCMGSQARAYYASLPSQCTPVDLRKNLSMPIRDQGKISWCYAHTAADFLQYFFKIPEQISAADIAIQYNLRPIPRLFRWLGGRLVPEMGFIRAAMNGALSSGYCLEKYFPSEKWSKRELNGKEQGELKKMDLKDAIQDLFDLQDWIQMGIYRDLAELPYIYEFPEISSSLFLDILQNSSRQGLLNQLRLAACENHRVDYPGSIDKIGMMLKGPRSFFGINAVLDEERPVAIDYFYGVLEHSARFPYSINELHTSLIEGRRFDPKTEECQYLVKNSFGTSCEGYDPSIECESGFLWVPESSLYRAMVSYEYIKRGNEFTKSEPIQNADDQDAQSEEDDLFDSSVR